MIALGGKGEKENEGRIKPKKEKSTERRATASDGEEGCITHNLGGWLGRRK